MLVNIRTPIQQYRNRYTDLLYGLPEGQTILSCFYLKSIKYARLRGRHIIVCSWIFHVSLGVLALSSFLVTASNWNAVLLYFVVPCVPSVIWYSSIKEKHRKSNEQMNMIQRMVLDSVLSDFSSENNDLIQDNLFLFYKDAYQVPIFMQGKRMRHVEEKEREYVIEILKNK